MESVILNLIHSLGSIQVYILDKVHKHGIHHNWKGFCKYNKKIPGTARIKRLRGLLIKPLGTVLFGKWISLRQSLTKAFAKENRPHWLAQNEIPKTRYAISAHGLKVTPADTGRLKLSVMSIDFAALSETLVTANPSVP